jgi:predicted NAD/FAD-dependent oxidoreductase
MTNSSYEADYGIIGAGISGLIAAQHLSKQGQSVLVIDKARGVGGRMATRRKDDAVWDHGAQYIRFHHPENFADLPLWTEKVLQPWFEQMNSPDGLSGETATRWKCQTGMTSLPKLLAEGLPLHLSTRIATLEQHDDLWRLQSEIGDTFQVKKLLITAPGPQAVALLETLSQIDTEILNRIKKIQYDPCLALLIRLKTPSNLPALGALKLKDNPVLAWLADNQQKGISPTPSVTLHASPEWSAAQFDANEDSITQAMQEAAKPYIGESELLGTQLMRWRYSQPTQVNREDEPFCIVQNNPLLVIAGDGLGGPSVEDAMRSGLAAATWLLGS